MLVVQPDYFNTPTPHCPTKLRVLEVIPRYQECQSSEERQLHIHASAANRGGNLNYSSTVSKMEEAVLRAEGNNVVTPTGDVEITPRGASGIDKMVEPVFTTELIRAERYPIRSPANQGGISIQPLQRDDIEEAGYFLNYIDSPVPATTLYNDQVIGEKALSAHSAVNKSNHDAGDCCTYLAESITATPTVEQEGVGKKQSALGTVGGWRGPRGRGRGRRILPIPASGPGVREASVETRSIEGTSRVGRGCFEREKGAAANEGCGAVMIQPYRHSNQGHGRSVGTTETGVIEGKEFGGTSITTSGEQVCGRDIPELGRFNDVDFQLLTPTPTQSQTIINESHLMRKSLSMPPISHLQDMNLPAVVDAQSCQGYKALNSRITAMEIELIKMSSMFSKFQQQISQTSKQKPNKPSDRQPDEIFADKRLMRIKAAAFVTGRPLSAHTCKQLVLNTRDNEPPSSFNADDIKSINDRRDCRDPQSLSKWAVFEMFSLQEMVGRNCLGGGHDTSAGGNSDIKKPFDECKMETIKTAVLDLYPQQNDAMRKAVWMKCVDKINTDVRYLFKVSMKKHEWLQLEF